MQIPASMISTRASALVGRQGNIRAFRRFLLPSGLGRRTGPSALRRGFRHNHCRSSRWRADSNKQNRRKLMKAQSPFIKSLAIAMTLAALLVATSVRAAPETEKSLYERLGGVFAIAAVVDHFSDAVVENPIVGKNSKNPPSGNGTRRTWTGCRASSSCEPCGSARSRAGRSNSRQPNRETELGLEEAHRDLKISPEEFDEVAAELGRSLDFAKVPARRREKSSRPSQHIRTR